MNASYCHRIVTFSLKPLFLASALLSAPLLLLAAETNPEASSSAAKAKLNQPALVSNETLPEVLVQAPGTAAELNYLPPTQGTQILREKKQH
ncbi:MAG: hypothetical protein HC904_00375 [Blastochloris sp.]|nr:hypothetical protein [Blastochloris sp.]